jgi:uncharacterized membrane protein
MSEPEHGWSDQRVEQALGNLLRTGVLLAAAVLLLGGIIYLMRHGGERPDNRVFHEEPHDLRSITGILGDVWMFRGRGIIQLGLLLLIATPVARVVFSLIAFGLQRDKTYVLVTLIVLTILLYSLFAGGTL